MKIVGGFAKGMALFAPPGRGTRPTGARVREALFSMLQDQVPGASILDGFAGAGALGIEALSRGARQAVFVEPAKSGLAALRKNLRELSRRMEKQDLEASTWQVIGSPLEGAHKRLLSLAPFDLLFFDPPYADWEGWEVRIERWAHELASPQALVVAEAPRHFQFQTLGASESAWRIRKQRRFGDTMIWIFEVGADT